MVSNRLMTASFEFSLIKLPQEKKLFSSDVVVTAKYTEQMWMIQNDLYKCYMVKYVSENV